MKKIRSFIMTPEMYMCSCRLCIPFHAFVSGKFSILKRLYCSV